MTGIGQKFGHGLALALCFGAISACQSAVETTEQPAPDSATTTEQPTIDEPATDSPDEASGSIDSSASTTATPSGTASAVETAAFEPEPIPPLPAECADPKTQMAMTTCAAAEYERADTQLNNVYRAVKTSVSANQADQLIVAEQAWLDFRDINCDFVASQYAGGSIEPMIYNGCMTQLTSDRTAVLEQTVTTTASLEVVDRELNAVYQELQTYLISAEQEHLTDAQLAWLDYRDAHCTFAGGNTNACLAQLTDIRTKQLEVQLESRSL
ncbi:MAG: lysozyme inhibitor LprI family protein [Cyanobacteria bacterium P01_C01_bin.120]